MAEGRPGSLAALTERLKTRVDEQRTTEIAAEIKHSTSIGDYFVAIEEILQGNPDGKALRHWIDSSALVLGKNLAKESLGREEGKNVAEGIAEITATEGEIAENHKALRDLAAAEGVDMETLLADGHDEVIQAIVALREEKTARIAELRTALRAYALELIHTLQEGNRRKLGMSKDELKQWQEKFAALESLPQDYRSFAARMEQDFVAAKRKPIEERRRYMEGQEQYKERSVAVSNKVWSDYAHDVVEMLNKEFPGDTNEETRRHLLAGLLRNDEGNFLSVSQSGEGSALIIKEELRTVLPEKVLLEIAKRCVIARTLSRLQLHDYNYQFSEDGKQHLSNRLAYEQGIEILASLDEQSSWREASSGGAFVGGGYLFTVKDIFKGMIGSADDKRERVLQERGGREIDFANQVDATMKFLFDALSPEDQNKITKRRSGYREVSPVWKDVSRSMAAFSPSISAAVTPDGVFYSRMEEPADQRVAMREAKEKAEVFMQGLSDTLNRDRLQHERQAVSPADVESKNNARILAAEQQALSTQAEAEAGRKAIEALKEKERIEQELRKELADMRASRDAAVVSWHEERENLRVATDAARAEKEKLEGDKDRLTRELATERRRVSARERKIEEEARAQFDLIAELAEALKSPGFMGGTLKRVVEDIVNRPLKVRKSGEE